MRKQVISVVGHVQSNFDKATWQTPTRYAHRYCESPRLNANQDVTHHVDIIDTEGRYPLAAINGSTITNHRPKVDDAVMIARSTQDVAITLRFAMDAPPSLAHLANLGNNLLWSFFDSSEASQIRPAREALLSLMHGLTKSWRLPVDEGRPVVMCTGGAATIAIMGCRSGTYMDVSRRLRPRARWTACCFCCCCCCRRLFFD